MVAAQHPRDIAADLDRRVYDAPGKAPPAKDQRDCGIQELSAHATAAARDELSTLAIGDDDRRKRAVRAAHVHRSRALATRARTRADSRRLLRDNIRRDRGRELQHGALGSALGVAESLPLLSHP